MKKSIGRGLALVLALTLMLGIMPFASALADDYASVYGSRVSRDSSITVSAGNSDYYDLDDLEITTGSRISYSLYTRASLSGSSEIDYYDDEYYEYDYARYSNKLYIEFYNSSTRDSFVVTVTFEADSWADEDYDYSVVCASNDSYGFYESDFDNPGGYGYELSDYYADEIRITFNTVPSYGDLEYGRTIIEAGDIYFLDEVEDIVYYKGSSSRTDSFSFTLYDTDGRRNIVRNATMYILNEAVSGSGGVATSFTLEYNDRDDEFFFTKSDFESRYSSIGSLTYVVIESLPSSREGVLYLGSSEVRQGDKLAYSKLNTLSFAPGRNFEDGVSFKWSGIDSGNRSSNVAYVTISNADYKPVTTDLTFGVKRDTSLSIDQAMWAKGFYDKNGDSLSKIKIISLPDSGDGVLYLGSGKISAGDEISYSNLKNVKFTPASGFTGTVSFDWNGSDGSSYALQSSTVTIYVERSLSTIAGDFTLPLDEDDTARFTAAMFDAAFVSSSGKSLHSIKITSLPGDGTLYLNNKRISRNAVISYSELGTLTYEAGSSFDVSDEFEYSASDSGSGYSPKGLVTIGQVIGGGNYELKIDALNKVVNLSFDPQTPDGSRALNGNLDAGSVADIASRISFEGATLKVKMTAVNDALVLVRTLYLDPTLFSAANLKKISSVELMDNELNTVTIDVKTASIASLYTYSSEPFALTLARQDLTDTTDSMTAGIARSVVFEIGKNTVTLPGKTAATLKIPYATASARVDMAVTMQRMGPNTYLPLISSKFTPSDGVLTANLRESGVYVAALNTVTFSDLPTTHWAYNVVSNLSARNVINGYTDGTFLPQKSVTRAEYIKLLIESLGLVNETAISAFSDVSKTDWHYKYISSAVKAGIITNTGSFNPSAGLTRQDMALYSYLAAYAAGIKLSETTAAASFSDEASISASAQAAVKAMQKAGIINGYTDGTFLPKGTTTRAEASKIISLLVEQMYAQ